jgi:DNA-binding MarR family transcriptional regulator
MNMENRRSLPVMSRLGVVFLTWRRHLESGVRPYGVTLKQQYLLRQIAAKEFLYPSDVAEMLFCDRPTATVVINNLKKYGFVQSEKDETNGRRQKVTLTQAGREKAEELANIPEDAIDPLACYSKEEKAEFERLLIKLHRHLKACGL